MTAHRTARITLGLGLAGSLALTGCGLTGDSSQEKDGANQAAEQQGHNGGDGGSDQKPEDVVKKAFDAWNKQTETSSTFRVTASDKQVDELLDTFDDGSSESVREDTERIWDEIRSTELTLRARSTNGEPLQDVTHIDDMDVAFDYVRDGEELVQLMETGDMEVYFRADVQTLLDEFGGSTAPSSEEIQAQLDALPKELSWVEDVYKAKWLGFDPEMVRAAFDDSEAGRIEQQVDPETAEKFEKALFEHSDVERNGDEYTMKIKVKQFVQQEDELVDGMLEDARQADPDAELPKDGDEIAEYLTDETFDVVYTIQEGEIRTVGVDPMQAVDLIDPPEDASKDERENFEKAKDLELPMEVEYEDEVGDFTAPKDAYQITEEDLSLFFGGGTQSTA